MLDNLLAWSRSQRNQLSFNPVETEVLQLFHNSIEILMNTADYKEINIEIEGNESFIITADAEMISTVIRNLVSNAIKFTPRGGKIIIGYLRPNDNSIEIYIKDNGVGISSINQQKLMKLGEGYTELGTEREKGTGLGLLLCKEFLKFHKSKLEIQSQEGKGSRFSFMLKA